MIFNGRFVVSAGCVLDVIEYPDVNFFPVHMDSSSPASEILVPRNSLISRRAVALKSSVVLLLARRCLSQITSAIVETVTIGVIPSLFSNNGDVHHYVISDWNVTHYVKSFLALKREPFPLIQPIIISGINDGILPSRKWDKLVRLILRLGNFMSNNMFGHIPTSNGIVLPAAIVSCGGR